MTADAGRAAAVGAVAQAIRTLVLTDSEDTAQLLMALLSVEPGLTLLRERAAGGAALGAVGRHHPHVAIVVDVLEDAAALVGTLEAAAPETAKVVIVPEGDVQGMQAASLAGATVTLFKPFDHGLLAAAVRQAHARLARQHGAASGPPQARQQRPRVVAVHGVKGGVGSTTIAVNLAAGLRRLTERRIAVVDADLLSGDAGVLLDLPPERDVAELLPSLGDLDVETVDSYFQAHGSGVYVLTAPEQIQRAEALRAEDVARTLAGLRPYFDYQVVDTPSRVTPVTLAVLDEADLVVVVVTPELVALRNAARLLRLTAQLGYPAEKLVLVVNRADTSRAISREVIEEQLQRQVPITIPSEGPALLDAMNAGELLVETRPDRGVAACIHSLAHEVAARFGWNPSAAGAAGAGARTPREDAAADETPAGPVARLLHGLPLFGRSARRAGESV